MDEYFTDMYILDNEIINSDAESFLNSILNTNKYYFEEFYCTFCGEFKEKSEGIEVLEEEKTQYLKTYCPDCFTEMYKIIEENSKKITKKERINGEKLMKELDNNCHHLYWDKERLEYYNEELDYIKNKINAGKSKFGNFSNEQGDTYTCKDCDYKYQTKNIAGISFKCPKCKSSKVKNVRLEELNKEWENLPQKYEIRKNNLPKDKELKMKEISILKKDISKIKKKLEIIYNVTKNSKEKNNTKYECFSCEKNFTAKDIEDGFNVECPYCNSIVTEKLSSKKIKDNSKVKKNNSKVKKNNSKLFNKINSKVKKTIKKIYY